MNKEKNKKIYLALIPILINCLSFILLFLHLRTIIYIILILMNIVSVILCIMFINGKQKSNLINICLIISITFLFLDGYTGIKEINLDKNINDYEQSEEQYIAIMHSLEGVFASEGAMLAEDGYLEYPNESNKVIVNKQTYEKQLKKYNEDFKITSETNYEPYTSAFDDKPEYIKYDYNCDGYIILEKDLSAIEEYLKEYPNSEWIPDHIQNKVKGTSYISCSGKYNYQTDGFDNNLLN